MWKLFFEICDFLCNFIPNREKREYIRRQKLFDWRKKYNALRRTFPNLNYRGVKLVKGGWHIAFIVDKKYVFKVRKFFKESEAMPHLIREQRITAAVSDVSPLRVSKLDIVPVEEYTFFRYDFIPGKNLHTFLPRTIRKYKDRWAKQLAHQINVVHHAKLPEIDDLKSGDGTGWMHGDMCSNMIVNRKTMQIVGIIDWEHARWGTAEREIHGCSAVSGRMRASGISDAIRREYEKLQS